MIREDAEGTEKKVHKGKRAQGIRTKKVKSKKGKVNSGLVNGEFGVLNFKY